MPICRDAYGKDFHFESAAETLKAVISGRNSGMALAVSEGVIAGAALLLIGPHLFDHRLKVLSVPMLHVDRSFSSLRQAVALRKLMKFAETVAEEMRQAEGVKVRVVYATQNRPSSRAIRRWAAKPRQRERYRLDEFVYRVKE